MTIDTNTIYSITETVLAISEQLIQKNMEAYKKLADN